LVINDGIISVPIRVVTGIRQVDGDSDGLSDAEEAKYGTNPQLPDSDADGTSDGDEVYSGANPNGSGDLDLVRVSEIIVNNAGRKATVTWKTSPITDGTLQWGPTESYGQYLSDFLVTGSHRISNDITESGKTYHFSIKSCLQDGRCFATQDFTYTAQ